MDLHKLSSVSSEDYCMEKNVVYFSLTLTTSVHCTACTVLLVDLYLYSVHFLHSVSKTGIMYTCSVFSNGYGRLLFPEKELSCEYAFPFTRCY